MVAGLATAGSAVCAAGGLWVNARVARQAIRTRELQVFDRIVTDLRTHEAAILEAVATGKGPADLPALRVPFLTTLEYLAFLINQRHLSDLGFVSFLSEAITHWYGSVLTEEERRNPNLYPEFKHLYSMLTDPMGPEATGAVS